MDATPDLPLPLLADPVIEPAVVALPAQPTEAASLPTEPVASTTVPSLPTTTVLPLADLETFTDTTPPHLKI
ncbi:hypothetical protein ACFX19_029239 [Malus domestica]